ncbi:hypothetical protein [Sinomonas sp. G460-2]|uniref:hypothetical protein n=1 Tax=Sinomonas sp. G460-2 TaxID=3393464 RepID=UPI0039F02861
MVEIMAAGAMAGPADPWAGEDTLAAQVLGILREVLDEPRLCEESKDNLRRLLVLHKGHPEQALYEHLRCIRSGRAG